jgi:hypothetical protein
MNVSPLIYNEEYDYLLCLFRGNKRFVLVNTNRYPDVRQVSLDDIEHSVNSLLMYDSRLLLNKANKHMDNH